MKKDSIDTNILAHTSWNCKYHIVFAPKYRRKVFFEEKRLEIREILSKPRVLVQGILRRYRGEEHESNKGVHSRAIKTR